MILGYLNTSNKLMLSQDIISSSHTLGEQETVYKSSYMGLCWDRARLSGVLDTFGKEQVRSLLESKCDVTNYCWLCTRYFITHLGEVTLLVKALIDNLCGVDLSEVQRNLRILNKRHLSVMGWMRFCRQIPEVIVNVGGFTATLQGLLLYLLHGLAPLLALLCSKLENHQQRNKESRRLLSDLYNPMFLNVLEELGIAVTVSLKMSGTSMCFISDIYRCFRESGVFSKSRNTLRCCQTVSATLTQCWEAAQ